MAPCGYVIYSPRAATSVNKSHIPSLPQNNPYLIDDRLVPDYHRRTTLLLNVKEELVVDFE